MIKRRTWKCDYPDCDDIVDWYRIAKGWPIKLCTKHNAKLGRERFGKQIEYSDLTPEDIEILEEKDEIYRYICCSCGFKKNIPIEEISDFKLVKCPKCNVFMEKR